MVINATIKKQRIPSFPCIMETQGGLVVLMIGKEGPSGLEQGKGVVILRVGGYEVGYYTDEWELDNFTPSGQAVTLFN